MSSNSISKEDNKSDETSRNIDTEVSVEGDVPSENGNDSLTAELSTIVVSESEDERSQKKFETEVGSILEKLRNLPSIASELKIPAVAINIKAVYLKLCKAMKVPTNSTFLSGYENEELNFSYQSIGPISIIPLAKALTLCKNLKIIDLKYNDLGSKCLPSLISLLEQNESISHLNLSSNKIGKGSSQFLRDLISQCYSVEFLDLSNNNFGDEELQEIGLAMMKVDSIKELNLRSNDFSSAKAPPFGSYISKCSALLKLDLSCNNMEEGAGNVFSGLKISNLTHLNISRNGIPDQAMPALASGLKANKSLQELDISYNFITKKGAVALASGLRGSSTLEIINLAHNPIQGSGASSLLTAVGSSLKTLDISGIKVNLAFIKTLQKYNKDGKDLKVLFGSEIRFDSLPRDLTISDESLLDRTNVVTFLEKMADEKGTSLRKVLKGIHGSFISAQYDAIDAKQDYDNKKDDEKKSEMTVEDLAKGLVTSPIVVPKALAIEVSELIATDGYVDMWELISKVRWKPDDLFVKVKGPKKPATDKGKAGKKK